MFKVCLQLPKQFILIVEVVQWQAGLQLNTLIGRSPTHVIAYLSRPTSPPLRGGSVPVVESRHSGTDFVAPTCVTD
jgi:hypothetical protein